MCIWIICCMALHVSSQLTRMWQFMQKIVIRLYKSLLFLLFNHSFALQTRKAKLNVFFVPSKTLARLTLLPPTHSDLARWFPSRWHCSTPQAERSDWPEGWTWRMCRSGPVWRGEPWPDCGGLNGWDCGRWCHRLGCVAKCPPPQRCYVRQEMQQWWSCGETIKLSGVRLANLILIRGESSCSSGTDDRNTRP